METQELVQGELKVPFPNHPPAVSMVSPEGVDSPSYTNQNYLHRANT